jgi:hypothetical protein
MWLKQAIFNQAKVLILHLRLLSDTPISLKFAAFPIHGCLPLQELGLSRF